LWSWTECLKNQEKASFKDTVWTQDKIVLRLDINIANNCTVSIRNSGLQILPIHFFFKGIDQAEQNTCIQLNCQLHASPPPWARNIIQGPLAFQLSSSFLSFAEMGSSESYCNTLDTVDSSSRSEAGIMFI